MKRRHIFWFLFLVCLFGINILSTQWGWSIGMDTGGDLPVPTDYPSPIPISPKNGDTVYTQNPKLNWGSPPGIDPTGIIEYQIRIGENPSFNPTLYSRNVPGTATQHIVDYQYDWSDNITLYWDIRARYSVGWGKFSEPAVFVINISLLPPPRLIRPSMDALLTELKPTFEWEAIPNATLYNIQISENPDFTGTLPSSLMTTSTSVRPFDNLKENTTYSWRVRGEKGEKKGSYSEVKSFKILTALPPITLESPPNGSIVKQITPGPVLSWRRFSGGGGYWVQLSTNRDFSSAPTYTVYENSYEVPSGSLEDSKTYYWRVKQAAGTEWRGIDPIWNFTVSVVPGMPWITNPPNGSRISSLRPTISWNAVPYATNYELELRDGSMSGPLVFRLFPTTTSIVSPYDLSMNKKYVWIIKACRRNIGCSGSSVGWFEVVIAAPKTTPSIPKQPPVKLPGPPSPPVKPPVK